jgi:hypothetical protein
MTVSTPRAGARFPGAGALMLVLVVLVAQAATEVVAGSHLWRINEVFSNADGSVQFVELYECCGAAGEVNLQGILFTSDATEKVFVFPDDLERPTTNRHLLLATKAFASLPGAPAPDYTIPDGFVGLDGDTLWYGEAQNYDRFVYGPGDLPTDGVQVIQLTSYSPDAFTTAQNSPTNYSGETGTIDLRAQAPFARADCNTDGGRNLTDVLYLLDILFLNPLPIPCLDACDSNDDGELDVSDALMTLFVIFPPARPVIDPAGCGADPTFDALGCGSFETCV